MSNLKLSPNHCLRDPKSGLEGGLEKERGREGKGQRERERFWEKERFFSFPLCLVAHLGWGQVVFDRGSNSPVHSTPCQLWEGVCAHSDPFGRIAPGNFRRCNGLSGGSCSGQPGPLCQRGLPWRGSPSWDPVSGPLSGSVLSHAVLLILCNPTDCSPPGFSVPGAQEYWSRLPLPAPGSLVECQAICPG